MKFINKSKKSIEVRTGERFNHSWINVKPGETIDLPVKKGKRYRFTKVTNSIQNVTEGKIGETKVETKQFEPRENLFLKNLMSINGIGKKTAKDILKMFNNEDELMEAIKNGDSLPFRDDVELKLRKKYGK